MSLIDLWEKDKQLIAEKEIHQVISFAGNGKLLDESETSTEFRAFISRVPSEFLKRYVYQCLNTKFDDSGLVLQDLVNQIGKRLGFTVEFGIYRGKHKNLNHDGLWRDREQNAIIVEVKTTTDYKIELDKIARYRKDLITQGLVEEDKSSILIVVGRKETADLEAQIRGSRHAWDIRLISVEALLNLLEIKEQMDSPDTIYKIHQMLIPKEFTKLDQIVELIFSTTEDVKSDVAEEVDDEVEDKTESNDTRIPKFIPVSFHDKVIEEVNAYYNTIFLNETRSTLYSENDKIALVLAISKQYTAKNYNKYSFFFHPHQNEFLENAFPKISVICWGCGSENKILLLPHDVLKNHFDKFHYTESETRGNFWHINLQEVDNKYFLLFKKGFDPIDVTEYMHISKT